MMRETRDSTTIVEGMPVKVAEWAREVVLRDGCCHECGATDQLRAVKIGRFDGFTLGNGRTLCQPHYNQHHNTRKQAVVTTERPQRRTYRKRIAQLELLVVEQQAEIDRLRAVISTHK